MNGLPSGLEKTCSWGFFPLIRGTRPDPIRDVDHAVLSGLRVPDVDHAFLEIEVLDPETEYLPGPHSRGQGQENHGIDQVAR